MTHQPHGSASSFEDGPCRTAARCSNWVSAVLPRPAAVHALGRAPATGIEDAAETQLPLKHLPIPSSVHVNPCRRPQA